MCLWHYLPHYIQTVGSRRADSGNEQAEECRDTKAVNLHHEEVNLCHITWTQICISATAYQLGTVDSPEGNDQQSTVCGDRTRSSKNTKKRGELLSMNQAYNTEAKVPRSNRWCWSILELQNINQHGDFHRDGPQEAHRYMKQLLKRVSLPCSTDGYDLPSYK